MEGTASLEIAKFFIGVKIKSKGEKLMVFESLSAKGTGFWFQKNQVINHNPCLKITPRVPSAAKKYWGKKGGGLEMERGKQTFSKTNLNPKKNFK